MYYQYCHTNLNPDFENVWYIGDIDLKSLFSVKLPLDCWYFPCPLVYKWILELQIVVYFGMKSFLYTVSMIIEYNYHIDE